MNKKLRTWYAGFIGQKRVTGWYLSSDKPYHKVKRIAEEQGLDRIAWSLEKMKMPFGMRPDTI